MATIGDRRDLERWLDSRSRAEAEVLAVRSALRAAPALRTGIGPSMIGRDSRTDGPLLYFGFAAKAWSEAPSSDTLKLDIDPYSANLAQTSADLEAYIKSAHVAFRDRRWDFVAAAHAASASRYAASISAVGSDAALLAANTVSEAAEAAALAVNPFKHSPAATEMTFLACAADATVLERGVSASHLLEQPLWLNGAPEWIRPNWAMVRCYMPLQERRRSAWVRWYERRLRGDVAHCTTPSDECLENLALRPAAIEPVWFDDRLNLADRPPQSQLGEETMLATLGALRDDMADLAADTTLLPNCDHRPSQHLSRLAQRILVEGPSQLYLFRLGNARDSTKDFLPTVEREWPEFFVSRFRALILQFDRTLGQFPKYRLYEDYRRSDALTETQMERASAVSKIVVEALENDEARDWLDPEIPHALRTLEDPLALAEGQVSLTPSIVRDLLESISNILKALLVRAIKRLGPLMHWTKSTMVESGKTFADRAKVSLIEEAGKAGDKVGRSVGKTLTHLGTAVIISGGLSAVPFLTVLTQDFPTVFGWLKSFECFIEKL